MSKEDRPARTLKPNNPRGDPFSLAYRGQVHRLIVGHLGHELTDPNEYDRVVDSLRNNSSYLLAKTTDVLARVNIDPERAFMIASQMHTTLAKNPKDYREELRSLQQHLVFHQWVETQVSDLAKEMFGRSFAELSVDEHNRVIAAARLAGIEE